MADLRTADLQAILGAVSTIYAARTLDEFGLAAVQALRGLVPGNGHGFNLVDHSSGIVLASTNPAECAEVDRIAAFNRHLLQHPVYVHTLESADPSALAISDFLSPTAFENTGLYDEYYRGIDARDQLSVVSSGPRFTVAFVVNREQRTFNAQERARLELIKPHLEQAYRHILELELLRTGQDESRLYTIIVDEAGRLRPTDDRAIACLDSFFGTPGPGRDVPDQLAAWLRQCRRAYTPSTASPVPPLPLIVRRGYRRLEIRYVPSPHGGNALLLLREWNSAAAPETLQQRFRLSRRQAEILAHLAAGLTDNEIAARLGLAHRSVTTMLHALYRRIGVTNRTGAVAMVFEDA